MFFSSDRLPVPAGARLRILGLALIVASIVLTGIYVMRANSDFDDLTAAIVAKFKGAK